MVKGSDDNLNRDDTFERQLRHGESGYYGDGHDDSKRRSNDADGKRKQRSSNEIRAEIERTRAEMDRTVDALQDRVSPERLVHTMFDMMRDNVNQAVRTTIQAVRDNPVPAALIGIGLIWLVASHSRRCSVPQVSVYEYDEYEAFSEPTQTTL